MIAAIYARRSTERRFGMSIEFQEHHTSGYPFQLRVISSGVLIARASERRRCLSVPSRRV